MNFPEAHKAKIRPRIGAGMGIAHAAGVQSRSKRADEVLITRLSAAGPAAVGLGESVRLE